MAPLDPFSIQEDYACDDDLLCLDNGGDWALSFNGDNSLSVEDYTCNNILSYDGGHNPLDGVNSLPPEGFTGNSTLFHEGGGDMATDGNTSVNNIAQKQDWRMSIPLGMKFRPTEELMINYLELESFGVTSPSYGIINRLDVYDYQPHQLPSFKKLMHHQFDQFLNRHGCGSWRWEDVLLHMRKEDRKIEERSEEKDEAWMPLATQAPKPIKGSRSGAIHGYKMPLAYYEEENKKTQWLMQEYKLNSRSSSPKEHDLVLAVIYYHHRKRRGEDEDN